ncbi:MAG: protein translocase subunit SecD [Planctomycetota bacterium]
MIISVLAVAAAIAFFYPPKENLRLGKDLRGGFSLVYAVQIGPGENADETMDRVIEVLKQRVDPNGLLEIAIEKQGRDRLEITMPLPNDEVKGLRQAFEDELDQVAAGEVDPRAFDRAIRAEPDEQEALFEAIAGDSEERLDLLRDAAAATRQVAVMRADYDDRVAAGAPEDELDELAGVIAGEIISIDIARERVVGSVLRAANLRRALELSDAPRVLYSDEADAPVEFASPREQRLTELREQHPSSLDAIDAVVEAYSSYESQRTTLDDPSDLIRQLRGSGVLEFRITVDPDEYPSEFDLRRQLREEGPVAASRPDVLWLEIESLERWASTAEQYETVLENAPGFFLARGYVVEEFDGRYYMLLWDIPSKRLVKSAGDTDWSVSRAFQGTDDQGRPSINFRMNPRGGQLLGAMTRENVQNQMAVVLDDKVYTAPNLVSAISDNGQITGQFTLQEISDIVRTLSAGSLGAKLSPEPISQSVLGPELGRDNLDAGLRAGAVALVVVSVFMVVYYFQSGMLAVISLACNAALILGALAVGRAALTLPGIAGIILTFGMAVDANVLIFERIREEMRKGVEVKPAVRLGYQKALSSIVDGNVTNLIVTFVLANIGTQEIKGFAITLGIGVVCTLFSALFISRVLFAVLIEKFNLKSLVMLPSAVPVIDRLLEPKINWLKGRFVFVAISLVYIGLGVGMIVFQNEDMLDTEFRGGTEVTLRLGADGEGSQHALTRPEVAERVRAIGESAEPADPLSPLRNAEVVPVNPDADGVTSDQFRIKTVATDAPAVSGAVAAEFADVLDRDPPLSWADQGADASVAPIYPITRSSLAEVTGIDDLQTDVSEFEGGAAILLRKLDPPPTLDNLERRLDSLRRQPDFAATLGRTTSVIVTEGTETAVVSAVVLVSDESISVLENEQRWREDLASVEWDLVSNAIGRESTPTSIRSFDATAARNFRANATVAVGLSFILISIYIWVRFGSIRYSLAALAALAHDVLTAIGLIALAEIVYEWEPARGIVAALGIQPFKIDLTLIAAMLTIIGYSLNDSIIIMDRIRENRGKLDYASADIVNLSINQTISRTIITSGTTLLAVLILYAYGGPGVRSFAYALLVGVLVGTYSSIAVAAPLVWSKRKDRSPQRTAGIVPAAT